MGLELTIRPRRTPVFKTGSSSGRMTSVIRRFQNSGGWNRTNGLLVQSQASLPTATAPEQFGFQDNRFHAKVRGDGIEPPLPGSKPGGLPLADPRAGDFPHIAKCPPGVEPGWPAWKAGASAARPRARHRKAEGEGVEPSRLIARLFSRQLPSPIGLPFRFPRSCGGWSRTSNRLLNRELPCHWATPQGVQSAWSDSNRRSPAPEAGGLPNFPTRRINNSTQRESNPHVRHGKAVGCRYIMGAKNPDRIVKEQEHRVGLEPTLPHYECGILAAG